jgi:hypothetical protein
MSRGVGLVRGPLSLVITTEELLERKVAAPVKETEITAVGIRRADHTTPPLSAKVGTNLTDKRQSLDRNNSLSD